MNKKIFIITLIFSILLLSLTSCVKVDADKFEDINKVLSIDYFKIDVSIKTSKNDLSLNSTYSIEVVDNDSYKITYSIEKYNELSIEGNNNSSNKSVISGSEVINNGNESQKLANYLEITIDETSFAKFKIQENTCSEYTYTDTIYKGKLNNPNTLLGINSTDCNLTIKYNSSVIEYIILEYTSNDYLNEIKYVPVK